MPSTITAGFDEFLSRLTPNDGETDAAMRHRASISACIKSQFGLLAFFRTGSFGNGTSISGYSDVDYFAAIPRDKLLRDSAKTLSQVCAALDGRFPDTEVAIDSPAVRVPFGLLGSETTEVVPADYLYDTADGHRVFDIPDGHGGWMLSSPEAHHALVREHDERLDGRLRPLIRIVKAWKYSCSVPVSSFYLELRTAEYAAGETSIWLEIDIPALFAHLRSTRLAPIDDPLGISSAVAACPSAQRAASLSALDLAISRIDKARDAAADDDLRRAFSRWDDVFGGDFPSYSP